MKGDFTRLSFAARKNYTRVLKQQGRVDLDADWNEQGEIVEHLRRTLLRDLVGRTGIPKAAGDFGLALSDDGTEVAVGPGRVYVDGLICQLDEPLTRELAAGDETSGQTDLVVLDVWQRHVTALEDPDLREVALGGPDTTTRLQTICQLRILRDAGADCDTMDDDWLPAPSGGRLTTGAREADPVTLPCDLPPAGGFRGLENRLYRVEIHTGGDLGTAKYKWSRDNGAVAFAIEEFPASLPDRVRVRRLGRDQVLTLRRDDWVEITDDERELAGEPGFMARVDEVDDATRLVTLDRDVPAGVFSPAAHARIRRWDQQAGADPDGLLTADSATVELEDGVEISFSGADFRTGDAWMFAARTATRDVERLTDAPPAAIEHHFCRVATVRWTDTGGGTLAPTLEPCDLDFPPLTDITADDVSYDNSNCDLVEADTVQEAIDRLCQARDLRHHNKHLHGWGIVCGLQVQCGDDVASDERRTVTVRPGYAIDCDGNDLLLDDSESVDVLTAIAALDEENPDDPVLDENGDGEVCIRLETDSGRRVTFGFEKYAPERKGLQDLLKGTLLLDFYHHCVERVVRWVIDEFTPDPEEEEMLVGPTHRRLVTFLNLLIQLWNPTNGRYVFLSRKEHDILRKFYDGLRGLLQSRTFCAMFEDARQFPDYPFDDDAHSTIFGKGNDSRLRVDPTGRRAYTVGATNGVHVFDLEKEEMVAEVEFPGGEGAIVRDVAFSPEGKEVYAVATVGKSTLFAVGEVGDAEIRWRPVSIACDATLVTLASWRREERTLYAIGKGTGLYRFDPTEEQVRPELVHPFNAVGHLALDDETGMAFATAAEGTAITDRYDRFLRIHLAEPGSNPEVVALRDVTGLPVSGDDDLAIDLDSHRVAVVVDAGKQGMKELLLYEGREGSSPVGVVPELEDTVIRLGYARSSRRLVLSFEDSFRLGLVETEKGAMEGEYRHPVQISPIAIAFAPEREMAYVLNQVSGTINTIPGRYLDPEGQIDVEALAEYRTGVIEAFMDLLGGFLQYLKDCFCDHLLVNCPDCDGDEKIYLACVSVRGGEVYRVCNFSRRKYVKSFPTVGYWLSVVPIWPLIRQAVERFCCSVPVLFFAQKTAPQQFGYEKQASPAMLRQGISLFQGADFRNLGRQLTRRVDVAKVLTRDWAQAAGAKRGPTTVEATENRVKQREVLDQSVEAATQKLEQNQVVVAEVKTYDPGAAPANLLRIATAPTELKAGQRVELYEEEGRVKYYAVVGDRAPAAAAEAPAAQPQMTAELESLRNELAELKTRVSSGAVADAPAPPQVAAELDSVKSELARVRSESEAAIAARDQQITELVAKTEELERTALAVGDLQKRLAKLERPG